VEQGTYQHPALYGKPAEVGMNHAARGERFRVSSGPGVRITTATLQPDECRRLAADLAAVLKRRAPMETV